MQSEHFYPNCTSALSSFWNFLPNSSIILHYSFSSLSIDFLGNLNLETDISLSTLDNSTNMYFDLLVSEEV